ncbi:MAG TPA: ATP-binding protein [Desulfobacteraceae bacterium]|nr:ATP-binding protein [Desulfobacteraceae bacterium]
MNINKLVIFTNEIPREGRLTFYKQLILNNVVPAYTVNGNLDIDRLDKYLKEREDMFHIRALAIIDCNNNILAGFGKINIDELTFDQELKWYEILLGNYNDYFFDRNVHDYINLPGYPNAKLYITTSGRTPILFLKVVRNILFISLFGILSTGLIIYIPFILFILKPINKMMGTVYSISKGDLTKRIDIKKGRDAVHRLAHSINKMADRIENLVSSTQSLTTNISHEIRTPLSQIKIALDIHRRELCNYNLDNLTNKLDLIDEDVEKIDRLVDQILKYSRQDLTEVTEKPSCVCLKEIILRLIKELSPEINYKELRIETGWRTHNSSVWAVPELMCMAFSNLFSNAVKFSPEGGSIRITLLSDNQKQTIVQIANTCNPLSPDELEKIFLPFYKSKVNNSQGTGLGLAIVKKIINNTGGKISAHRWNNHGICFEIILPSLC